MKYIELFKNGFDSTIVEKTKPENYPYVGYSPSEGLMLTEIRKEGEIDPTAGYVDLGLSVMWASCDVGTTIPEGEGIKYPWGELSWETIPLEFDPVYMNSDMELKWKEALQPRTPSPAQVKELLDNTTATEEVLNGVSGMRYTASNGNSIFVSNVERWTNAFRYLKNPYSFLEAACWNPDKGIIDNTATANSNGAQYTMKTYQYPFRGVCSNLPQGSAILLEYGKTVQVDANALYCFPRTWTSTSFVSPTDFILTMYASPSYDFAFDSQDCYIYSFSKNGETGRVLNLSTTEISSLTGIAKDDYVYVRFACNAPFSITPEKWETSQCVNQSTLIRPNEAFFVFERSSNTIFRLRYADWVGYDITIEWDGYVTLPTYISDTCSYTLSSNNSHVLKYAAIKSEGTFDISAATIDTWASRVDEDGYLYVRFNPKQLGVATFTSTKPSDVDPVSTTSTDCGCAN